ncbi:MAG: excinuclease ABC subunit UvrC [Clostridia bacterium]|nr:excinuclease ABC subunit UvrC [Clostridia bacterium]
MSIIEDKLKLLPTDPGVYVMLNKDKQIIYVGKAKNLKNRVRQYFFNSVKTEKVMAMVKNIADFYYIITPSEIDALSLENNLIKKHKPRYNILLKDDKTYPYLKVNVKEKFPSITVTRKIKKDGAKYCGPFMGGVNVSSVLEILNMVYLIRPCDKKFDYKKPVKPCLNYHLKKCLAPCAFLADENTYRENVNEAIDFLSGDTSKVEKILKEKMTISAENEEFELALRYKQGLESLEKIGLKRLTALNKFINADILAYTTNGLYSTVNILFVRNGRMMGGKNFSFENAFLSSDDALREFIMRYYKDGAEIPDEIIVGIELTDSKLLEEYFKNSFNKQVAIICAKTGVRKQLTEMAEANAEEHLNTNVNRIVHKEDMTIKACEVLKEKLSLSKFPHRMECFDISNISGVDKVASMVVFIDGVKEGTEYRRFKIKTFEGADDFKSLQEVLDRRIERLNSGDSHFSKPDLIIIDGGKGQLSSVKEIFDKHKITDIDLISLAEKNEEVYLVGKQEPVVLDKHEYCLKLLQRIRDEAHRFAITYFRSLHDKRNLSSVLDRVKGIGKAKQKALIEKFKDLGGIISANKEELKEVDGIGDIQAELIIEQLKKEGLK